MLQKIAGHSEDSTFHASSKTVENFKRVHFIMKLLPQNWLKWRGKTVPKESCGCFLRPLHGYIIWNKRQVLNKVLGPADIVVEARAKTCSEPSCNR